MENVAKTVGTVGASATPGPRHPAANPAPKVPQHPTGGDEEEDVGGRSDAIAATLVLAVVAMLIVPIPPFLLDLLLAVSICVSVTVMMTAIYMDRPVEFSSFPSLLLMVTLFRLTLNVASTRLILLRGHEGPDQVGAIIKAFGLFVAGGDMIVGLVIFMILVLINFIVITKGSGRIAEVAARFTLDALPGKQMSIDADLNAGIIGEEEAKTRRRRIEQEADFYGAMDGASKFVRGDAVAGMVVTAINIVGGILIGTVRHGIGIGEALDSYALLTIGDGLVSQLPALVVSTAAGVVVSRAAGSGKLGGEIGMQVLSNHKPLFMTSVLLGVLALVPGLPGLPMFLLSGALYGLSRRAKNLERKVPSAPLEELAPEVPPEEAPVEDLLHVETLELEVGYALVPLVDSKGPNALMKRISGIRRQLAQSLGILLPSVRVRDNLQLEANEYVLYLRTVPIARGTVEVDHYLAINPGTAFEEIEGHRTKEPAFGLDAYWIDESQRDHAEAVGYTTVDASTVIATHLGEELRRSAADLVGRQELQELLESLRKTYPKIVEEIMPKQVTQGDLLRVVRSLLAEQVPIRDLRTILETLADLLPDVKTTEALTEAVRQRLAASITHRLAEGAHELHAYFLEPELEQALRTAFNGGGAGAANLDGAALSNILSNFEDAAASAAGSGYSPVVIVAPDVRRQVRDLIARFLPNVAVLSHREVDGKIEVRSLGRVSIGRQ